MSTNCERKREWAASRQKRCTRRLRKIGFRVAHCKKNQTSAKKNWLGCNRTIKTVEHCMGCYHFALACLLATDHLDRDRGILRGCPGTVVGWKLAEAQHGDTDNKGHIWNVCLCAFSFVLKGRHHGVDGLSEDSIFPVTPPRKPWFRDKGRGRPVLRVTRRQLPLAPRFAATAHAAQWQTYRQGRLWTCKLVTPGAHWQYISVSLESRTRPDRFEICLCTDRSMQHRFKRVPN